MRLQRISDGESVHLDPASRLSTGSFGRVFAVLGDRTLAAKVYNKSADANARKLAAMIALGPNGLASSSGHCSLAWPIDLLGAVDDDHRIVGFLMPRVVGMRPISDFFDPVVRGRQDPSYRPLLRIARNLAATFSALHAQEFVVGGIDDTDILVSENGSVTLVGTDAFQVRDPVSGELYACSAGKPEYRPPELQGSGTGRVERSAEHDCFGLAVLLFQLLMEGTHPFDGTSVNRGDTPTVEARIAAGQFPYSATSKGLHLAPPQAPSFQTLHPTLRDLFVRCFVEGHSEPGARPHAREWQVALAEAELELVPCLANRQHVYGRHLRGCPWCGPAPAASDHAPLSKRTISPPGDAPGQEPTIDAGSRSGTANRTPPRSIAATPPAPVVHAAPRYRRGASAPPPPGALPTSGEPINPWAWLALIFALLALAPQCYLWAGSAAVVCGILGWFHGRGPGTKRRWLPTVALGLALAVAIGVPVTRHAIPGGLVRRVAGRASWLRLPYDLKARWRLELERRRIRAHLGTRQPARAEPPPPALAWQSQERGDGKRTPGSEPRGAGGGHPRPSRHVASLRKPRLQRPASGPKVYGDPLARAAPDPEDAARDRMRRERLRELAEDLVRHEQERARRLRELDEDLAAREKQRQERMRVLTQDSTARPGTR